jgi:hypothetical protein
MLKWERRWCHRRSSFWEARRFVLSERRTDRKELYSVIAASQSLVSSDSKLKVLKPKLLSTTGGLSDRQRWGRLVCLLMGTTMACPESYIKLRADAVIDILALE